MLAATIQVVANVNHPRPLFREECVTLLGDRRIPSLSQPPLRQQTRIKPEGLLPRIKQESDRSRRLERGGRRSAVPALLLLTLLAFALRLIVVLCVFRELPASADHNEFGWEEGWIARSIALGHGFSSPFQPLDNVPTALVAPLYPYLLAGMFRLFGLYSATAALVGLGLNAAMSASVVMPVYALARHVAGAPNVPASRTHPGPQHSRPTAEIWRQRTPWIAATLWALYPYAITFAGSYLWDHTLTGVLFAWTFFVALQLNRYTWRGWALWGLLYGVTALANPSTLSLFPALAFLGVIGSEQPLRSALNRFTAASAVLFCTLLPWTVRNIRVLHAPIPIRDGFWGEFYAGNNDDTSYTNPSWTHPASSASELRRYEELGEIGYMAEKRELAVTHVVEHPAMFALQSARRLVRFWTGFWSFASPYLRDQPMDLPNVPFCTALSLLMLLGMRVLVRQRSQSALPFLAVLAIFPVPYYLTHASVDYRLPIEPEIVVLIALGAVDLARTRQDRITAQAQIAKGVLVGS